MDQIEFADGFDRADTLAFGLGAGQLAVVMAGALAAYSLVRSPLPPAIADPVAVVIAAASAGLGWVRVSGRPALDRAVFAGLFWLRTRRGITRWALATAMPPDGALAEETPAAPVIRLFGRRSDQRTPSSSPPGDPPSGDGSPVPTPGPSDRARVAPQSDPTPALTAQPPLGPNIPPTLRPPTRADGARHDRDAVQHRLEYRLLDEVVRRQRDEDHCDYHPLRRRIHRALGRLYRVAVSSRCAGSELADYHLSL